MGRPKGAVAKRKINKDPNKPKRPTSAYFYYVARQRQELEKQGKKVTKVAEWTKEVSAKWRALTDEEKVPFDKMAKKDKERYTTAMSAYKGKDANKPKRPMSSYFLWLGDFRAENKEKFAENKDLLRAAGENWRKLTDAEKKPYEIKAEGEKRKYEENMRQYAASGGGAAAAAAAATAASKAKKAKMDNGADDDDDDDEEEEEDDEEEDDDDDDDE